MRDKWMELHTWEEDHKANAFVVVTIEDVRETNPEMCKDLTDEEIHGAMSWVSRKSDNSDYFTTICDWIAEVARENKDQEK